MDTYCSIATKAREEWQSKGFLITKRFFECGSRLIVYYNKDTMWNAIYDYVLHHPEEVVLLDINYRKKVKTRKLLGIPNNKKVTAKDIELAEAIKNKKIEPLKTVHTFADGISVKCPGEVTYDMVSKYVDDVVTVTDDETAAAILTLMEKQKVVSEGAGAASVAAVLFNKIPVAGKKVVCVVSGGNIDVNILSRVINRGLIKTGRKADLTLELLDKPGQLEEVSHIVASMGANVTKVDHNSISMGTDINGCYLTLQMETRNFEHIEAIRQKFVEEGFKLITRP
jgi:hypothetical protein